MVSRLVFTNELREFLDERRKTAVNKVCMIKLSHPRGSLHRNQIMFLDFADCEIIIQYE